MPDSTNFHPSSMISRLTPLAPALTIEPERPVSSASQPRVGKDGALQSRLSAAAAATSTSAASGVGPRSGMLPAKPVADKSAAAPSVNDKPWPAGRVQVQDGPGAGFEPARGFRPGESQAGAVVNAVKARSTAMHIGRPLPPVIPQTVGRDFEEPIGKWPQGRADLFKAMGENLHKLADMEAGRPREQLHLELTLHWHCLSEIGKRNLLQQFLGDPLMGDLSRPASDESARTPVRDWFEHTMGLGTDAHAAKAMLAGAEGTTHHSALASLLGVVDNDKDLTLLRSRFAPLRFEQAMNDGVDYGGFMHRTNRVYAHLPPEKLGMKVVIVGGGPTGIVAADGLNRMGMEPIVLEQGMQIGGRVKTTRTQRRDGTASPSKIEQGAMRANFHNGNPLTYLVNRFDIPTKKFVNPGDVDVIYQMGNEIHRVKAGQKPSDKTMLELDHEYDQHVEKAIYEPIRRARDAGDTARFYELTAHLEARADKMNFQGFIADAFERGGGKLSQQKKDVFDVRGIGVGGYKGYNNIAAAEEARFTIDERVEKHHFIPEGFDTMFRRLATDDEIEKGRKDGKLPCGLPYRSLASKDAIRLNAEVTNVARVDDGSWLVTYVDKLHKAERIERAQDVIFAAPPGEAVRLGLTDGHPAVPRDLAFALEKANIVGATKMAVKIPKKVFDDFAAKGIDLNVNLQSSKRFQQAYVLPEYPAETTPDGRETGPAQSRVVFVSYTLGDNSVKESGLNGAEKMKLYRQEIAGAARASGDEGGKAIMAALAEALEHVDNRDIFVEPWSLEKHFYGAFKMDAAFDKANTQLMHDSVLKGSDMDALLMGNEQMTFESGFARGAVAMGINMAQKLAVRHGGTLPPNSPFEQRRLDDVTEVR